MSWLPGWYSTEHRSYTAGQTLVPSVGSLYSHWTHLGKCIDVATSLQARSSILFDIIQQVPCLSSRHCCVVLTIIIRHCIAFAFTFNCIWDTTSDILFHVRVFPESQLASPYQHISAVLPHLWHYIILTTSNMCSCHVYEASVFSCWRDLSMGLCLICSVWTSRESMWALVILGVTRELQAVWI